MPHPLDPVLGRSLLDRWDAQQERYISHREERFDIIIEAVRLHCDRAPVVIDLAGGPGSLGYRIVKALPHAAVWSVDADPLLQSIGASTYEQIRWVETDLRRAGWSQFLDGTLVDAVVSTTALHWLSPDDLFGVYRELTQILRPGGIFLDGDHCNWSPGKPVLSRLADELTESLIARSGSEVEDWASWWDAVSKIPALEEPYRIRQALYSGGSREHRVSASFHIEALLTAGFSEAATLWQIGTDFIIAGIR
jgi:SAM-dependent methyltransferase